MKNLVLAEAEFEEFQKYCKNKGFDLNYFSEPGISSEKELENFQLEKAPRVAVISKKRFGKKAKIYDVAEWQREKWQNSFWQISEEFSTCQKEKSN